MPIINLVYEAPRKWKPWANTLLYLPLESDIVDQSWQAITRVFSSSWISYTTVGGVTSLHTWTTWWLKLTTPYPLIWKNETNPVTVSVLVYVTSQQTSDRRVIIDRWATNGNRIFFVLEWWTTNIRYDVDYNGVWKEVSPRWTITANQWMHLVLVSTTASIKGYKNGELVWQITPWRSNPWWYRPYSYDNTQWIFCTRDVNNYWCSLNWNARELIVENKEWTTDDVSSYYNYIKNKLGF
jgi:hypothetical protein